MSLTVGIDPSLTATALVPIHNGELVNPYFTTNNQPKLHTVPRVLEIIKELQSVLTHLPMNIVVIEGFSFGSKGRSVFDTGYLGFRIREELIRMEKDRGIPWIEVSPSQLKQFATEKGNSPKEVILQQVYKRWGVEFSDNNLADAYVLAQIGRAYIGEYTELTKIQREVIEKLKGAKS